MPNELVQTKSCPPQTKLLDYLLGRVPDAQLGLLETHFADCEVCEETLNGLGAEDTFSRLAGDALAEPNEDQVDRDFVSKLVNQLQGNERFRIQPRAVQERAAEVIRLLAPSASPESLGQLANYRIEKVLGAGSSGVVFYAVDESLNRPVALKVLRPSLGSIARQRFMIEARATASTNHPQIVTIYQVGQEHELAFIAMQWIPGETLESRLERVTFLAESEVRAIAEQIATGLQAAHEKTLVHRDIKPANIWLCDKTNEAKILDFGLARIADEEPNLTSTGMLAGTPNFMSPEQSRGQELDGRTDLFSLGCLMYQAATGKLPFGEKGILATLQSIQHHHPRPPIALNPNLDVEFSDLVMCLLEKQPANRPNSAAEVAEALVKPRENWAFPAANYLDSSALKATAAHVEKSSFEHQKSKRKANWMPWIASMLLVGLAAWGWSIFGQQIIRIATNQGEIIIESNDENIKVEILKDGKLVRVVDLKTEQQIEIKAGDYEIKAGTVGNDNSISVSPNKLTMSRGGKQVVSISRLDPVSDTPGAISANRNEPTFDGRTFDDWLRQMQHEKSQDSIREGAVAIGTLSRDDDIKVQQALNWIRPLIREHGSMVIGGGSTWPETFNAFFTQLDPRHTVAFAIEEMVSGNSRSREQMVWSLVLGSVYEGDSHQITEHQKAIQDQFQVILDKGLKLIEDDAFDGNTKQIRDLLAYGINSATQDLKKLNPGIGDQMRDPESVSKINKLLEARLAASHDPEAQAFLASQIITLEADSPLAAQMFCERLADPNISDDLTCQMFFNHMALLKREHIPQVVPSLMSLFDNDSLCDQLANYTVNNRLLPSSGGGHGGFGGAMAKPVPPEINRLEVRRMILERMGNYGDKATGALPWLDSMASNPLETYGGEALATQAKRTANQIRFNLNVNSDLNTSDEAGEPDMGSEDANADGGDSLPTSDASIEKTLHGETLAEWINILKTELDRATMLQACESIGELAVHDSNMSANATRALIEWLEANREFPTDDSRRPRSTPAFDVVIAAAIKSLSKIPMDDRELALRSVETVTRVARDAPVIKGGIGSTSRANELIQDAIGNAACRFFARHLEQEQAIEFIEQHLVAGTDQSSFRLRQLPGEPEFVTKITQVMPALVESIKHWSATAPQEPQRSCTHEFLRLGIFCFKNDEYESAAETILKGLTKEQKKEN